MTALKHLSEERIQGRSKDGNKNKKYGESNNDTR